MLLLSLLLIGASAQRACERIFWRGQCTACPGYWYQSCGGGNSDAGQRGCGFLGCETKCRDPNGNGYDYGCGCGQGQGCLKKDCTVSAFGAWGTCSKSCGGGKQSRTRSVTQQPANGGAACPPLREERACNTGACPTPKPTVSPTPNPTQSPTQVPTESPSPSPTQTACPEFALNKYSLKAKGKGSKKRLNGDNAEDVLCQCENICKEDEGSKYWSCKLNKKGNKGSCVCYSGKLKKIKKHNKKNGAVGAVNDSTFEDVEKKLPEN